MSASPGDLLDRFRLGEPTAIATVARLVRYMVGEKGYFVPHDERDDVEALLPWLDWAFADL